MTPYGIQSVGELLSPLVIRVTIWLATLRLPNALEFSNSPDSNLVFALKVVYSVGDSCSETS